MSNIFSLVSYACGGKTSLLPVIKWNLQLKYPDKHVIIINESVSYGFIANSVIENLSNTIMPSCTNFDDDYSDVSEELVIQNVKSKIKSELFDFDQISGKIRKQIAFLSSSIAQIDFLSNFINDNRFIIIMDRSFVDVFVFTCLNIEYYINAIKQTENIDLYLNNIKSVFESYREMFIKKYKIDIINDIKYILLSPPENEDVVKKCMERMERKSTISYNDFYSKCEEFENIVKSLINESEYKKFNHPSDNTYVVYKILDYMTSLIK